MNISEIQSNTIAKFDEVFKVWLDQNPVLASYFKRGYLKSKEDITNLHMAHSPYCVPRGLTKLQIRRRINHYLKYGSKTKLSDLFGNRMEVIINGKRRLSCSFGGKEPKTTNELLNRLKSIAKAILTSKPAKDTELF